MGPVSITFNLTVEDMVACQVHNLGLSRRAKTGLWIKILLIPAIIILFMWSGYKKGDFNSSLLVLGIWAIIIWVTVYLKSMSKERQRIWFRKLFRGDNSSIIGRHILEAGEDGLILRNATTETRFQWQAFKKLEEDKYYFFLYNAPASAIVIPKTKVSGDMVGFMAMIRERVKE